jgi:hypothetical protein
MAKKRDIKKITDYFIDILLGLATIATLAAGYIIWFVLPKGTGLHGFDKCLQEGYGYGNIGIALGLPRFIWVDIHNWASAVLLCIVILHIMLHLKWFVNSTKEIIRCFTSPAWKLLEQYLVSIALFILFIFESISGFVIWLILPRGDLDYTAMTSGNGRTFWELQRNTWVDLHAWIAVIIISITIIHLICNWAWVVATSKNIYQGIIKTFQKGDNNAANQS